MPALTHGYDDAAVIQSKGNGAVQAPDGAKSIGWLSVAAMCAATIGMFATW